MSLASPWFLLALPVALGLVWAVAARGHRTVPAGQHRLATVIRSVAVTCLVLALAGPSLVQASSERTVIFLVDRSASITGDAAAIQDRYLDEAIAAAGSEDRTAVAVFGADVRIDRALTTRPSGGPIRTVIDTRATDLSGALRSVAAVMPTAGSRRIVVLTDGVETDGDARAAAADLAERGVAVDMVTVESGRASDALVVGVEAPTVARPGDRVPVRVRVRSSVAGPAVLRIDDGTEVRDVPVDLPGGDHVVELDVTAGDAGVLRVNAEIDADFDTVDENNATEALVHVLGPARIAVVEGRTDEGADLVRALDAGGMEADLLRAVPTAAELLDYDGVVLVNVPAPPDELSADLAAYVEDLGRGLVVVGGDQSFGLGNYQDTALEALLPVQSDPDELIRRQPVAQVLVIDTSGSMADCHCDGIGDHDPSMQGGVNKTDISRAGAALAIDALAPTDRIGVLAFTSGNRWALPLGTKPDQASIDQALGSLVPAGDTEVSQALRAALDELRQAPEEIRHMVLFTDGWGDDPDALSVAQEIAAEGITLSVLGTGEGTGETLRRMASLGGGQFYAGADLEAVPEVFVEETLRVARPLIAEGAFVPALAASSPVTAGLTAAPPLRGYVLTKPKPTSSVALEIGPGDPLLASWQRGLGRATTWTSDATTRWSADWVSWDGFVDFWGRLVSDVLPPGRETPPQVRLDGGTLQIGYDIDAPLDAVAVAHVRGSDGERITVPMQRTAEGRFDASIGVRDRGAYWVAVEVSGTDGIVGRGSSGAVAGYGREFAFDDVDPTLAADVTEATGGRAEPDPAVVYEAAPQRGSASIALWPWLVALALALFLVDVAMRRLVFARGDMSAWRKAARPARKEPVKAVSTKPAAPTPTDGTSLAPPPPPVPDREVLPEEQTLEALLRRKRAR